MKVKKNSIRIFSIITVLVLTVLACGGTSGATTRDLEITVSAPSETINVGDTYTITVALYNSGSYNLELSSIQLPSELINSGVLISTNPVLSAGTTTGDFNNLDIDPFTPKYWSMPAPTGGINCQTGSGTIATTTRGVFTVTIDCNGTLTCTGTGCPPMPN